MPRLIEVIASPPHSRYAVWIRVGKFVGLLCLVSCSPNSLSCVNVEFSSGALDCDEVELAPAVPGPHSRGATGAARNAAVSRAEVGVPLLVWGDGSKIFASDGAELDEFGFSVSIAPGRALVGAYGESAFRGAAYVFVYDERAWREAQKLTASDGVESDDFGRSVSINDERALIGASGTDYYRGAAYLFIRDGDVWRDEQKLMASDGAYLDQLGWSVALTNDRALIGAYGKDSARGAAYIFVHDGTSWKEGQKLVALDGAAEDRLGYAVALNGDSALVGAPGDEEYNGAAYVFARDGDLWVEEQKLIPSDVQAFSQFGAAVAIHGDQALIGAAWVDGYLEAAYLFARRDGAWLEVQKLVAGQGASGERFGNAVSLNSGRALIGAVGSEQSRGMAYIFQEDDGVWYERQRLRSRDGVGFDLFGNAVSLADNQALVGANYADQLRGAAYTFNLGSSNGDACSEQSHCASGYCVDHVCCDADCEGSCGACSVAEGAVVDGACTLFQAGSAGSPNCGNMVCDGQTAKCAACQSDAACPEGKYCTSAGTCAPSKDQGESCDLRATYDCYNDDCRACRSGSCVDGVCCSTSCGNLCEACLAVIKGSGIDGECGPITAGRDPQSECSDDGASVCEHNGLCDGAWSCQHYDDGTNCKPSNCTTGQECTSGYCEDGICCDRVCGPNERCRAELKVHGGDGVCGLAVAAELGATCEFDVQCTSGLCADGICAITKGKKDVARDGCACRTVGSGMPAFGYWVLLIAGVIRILRATVNRDNGSERQSAHDPLA